MSEQGDAPLRDLWGQPIPDAPAQAPLIGPRHLEIPHNAADWFREYLVNLDPARRDRAIKDFNQQEQRREQAREREHRRWQAGNPLLITFGPGPEGETCRNCAHLFTQRFYFKCQLRGRPTHGSATDHRAKWPACGRFEPKQREEAS